MDSNSWPGPGIQVCSGTVGPLIAHDQTGTLQGQAANSKCPRLTDPRSRRIVRLEVSDVPQGEHGTLFTTHGLISEP